ncbi:Peptidase family S41 [Caballeronia arvi]|uniref:Peptidase family S41 n=1 Tax=Caballeronia arvi TaxID=1777135 RepID=A0A158JQG6_9BURK|nr:S41 family peptidase [Caballeronia arvi]SAL70733.1 Peptidase family S41 [Caballeronia arvi]
MATRTPSLLKSQTGVLLAERAGLLKSPHAKLPAASRDQLDAAEREVVVDALLTAIAGAYCHLHQKRAGYANDPVQALELLRTHAADMSEAEFHMIVTGIIVDLRDAHTLYAGPTSLAGAVAQLPFLVEQYGSTDAPSFLVTKVAHGKLIADAAFRPGVLLDTWNGMPFERAVAIHADRETGGRPDARLARALESLTFRSLQYGAPPDELWVEIGFRDGPGKARREVRIPWRIVWPGRPATGVRPGAHTALRVAVSPAGEQVRRAKKLMFSGKEWRAENQRAEMARDAGWIKTRFPDALSARTYATKALGEVGYLRIWTFDVGDHEAFVAEVIRLVEQLPDTGLIVDVRGNPGGLIWAAERLLQLFTPNKVAPTRFSLVATPLTRAMAKSAFNRMELEPWIASLESAISTGEAYSQALPITDPSWCDDVGQRYGGPVVCVADANTYSSGDLFCAGFVDNEIGALVCVGQATGAGGANVWTSHDLADALDGTDFALPRLPDGVSFTMAFRRAVRSGDAAGVPIEDLGIAGIPYAMTRRDVLDGNADLIDWCAQLLSGAPYSSLHVALGKSGLTITTAGLDELELYVDGRPAEAARAMGDGVLKLPRPAAGAMLEVVCRKSGFVAQRRRIALG